MVCGCAGLQGIFVTFGGVFFRCTGLSPYHWGLTIGFGALTLPAGFIVRLLPTWDRSTDFSAFYASWFYAKMRQAAGGAAGGKEAAVVAVKAQA